MYVYAFKSSISIVYLEYVSAVTIKNKLIALSCIKTHLDKVVFCIAI